MSIIALVNFKGSPGTTTAAVCLAATWPNSVLLVEADPAGGDLVTKWDGLDPALGLVPLGSAARRSVPVDQIEANTQRFGTGANEGIDVLIGVDHHSQALALESSWPNVMAALGRTKRDVIIDVGRLLPNLTGGARAVLESADMTLIVMRATLDSALKVKNNLGELSGVARALGLLVVGDGYATPEIESVLGVEVVGRIPHDDKGARLAAGKPQASIKSALVAKSAEVALYLCQRMGHSSVLPQSVETELRGPSEARSAPPLGMPSIDLISQPEKAEPLVASGFQVARPTKAPVQGRPPGSRRVAHRSAHAIADPTEASLAKELP